MGKTRHLSSSFDQKAFLRILNFFLLALALTALLTDALHGPALLRRLFCPTQVVQTEADIVESSLDILQGRPLWTDYRKELPIFYAKFSYPYSGLQALLMKWIGGIWLPGRLVSFFFYLGSAALLAFWGFRRWKFQYTAVFTSLFLLSPTWAFWSTVTRPDSLMVFFDFACLLLVLAVLEESGFSKGEKSSSGYWMVAGAGFFNALAILTKYNAGTTAMAVALTFLLKKRWSHLAVFLACSVALDGAVMLFWQWESGGLFFLGVQAMTQDYDFHAFWYYLTQSFIPEAGWLAIAVPLAWFWGRIPLLLKCQVAISFLWLFSLGHVGGAENYYLEPILFALFALGESLRGEPKKGLPPNTALFQGALCILLLAGFYQMNLLPWPQVPSAEEQEMKKEAIKIFNKPGEYLAIDEDLLLMAGKRIWLQVHGYREFVESKWLTTSPLVSAIRENFFASIELYDLPRQPFLPGDVEDEIKKDYTPRIRKWGRVWYFPKNGGKALTFPPKHDQP